MSNDPGIVSPQTYPPQQAPPAAAAVLPALRIKGTLATAAVAVMVAQIANALPGSLNGEFQQTFNTVGSTADLDHGGVHDPRGGLRADVRSARRQASGTRKLVIGGAVARGASAHWSVPLAPERWRRCGSVRRSTAWVPVPSSRPRWPSSPPCTTMPRNGPAASRCGRASCPPARPSSPLLGGVFASHRAHGAGSYGVVAVLSASLTVVSASSWSAAEHKAAAGRRLDLVGPDHLRPGLILVLFGLVQGPEDGWGAPHVVFRLRRRHRSAGRVRRHRDARRVTRC